MLSGASLGSAGGSRAVAAAQLCSPRTGTCGSAAAPALGPESGEDSQCLHAVNANEAIRMLLLLENQTIVQTIRHSFHLYTCTLVYAKV